MRMSERRAESELRGLTVASGFFIIKQFYIFPRQTCLSKTVQTRKGRASLSATASMGVSSTMRISKRASRAESAYGVLIISLFDLLH